MRSPQIKPRLKAGRVIDVIILAPAVVLLTASGVFVGTADPFDTPRPGFRFSPADSWAAASLVPPEPVPEPVIWEEPKRPENPKGWTMNLFTTPTLYRAGQGVRWSLTPPPMEADRSDGEGGDERVKPFDLEPLEIALELYPLQLVGFVGGPDAYLGTFENVRTRETFLGKPGREVPHLPLSIETLRVERRPMGDSEEEAVWQWLAQATLIEQKTGRQVVLSSHERNIVGGPRVRVREVETGLEHWMEPADQLSIGNATYSLDRVDVASRVVEIVRLELGGATGERKQFAAPLQFSAQGGLFQ